MKEVKAYQCDYCKFYRKTKSAVVNHEENCYYNPKNRACATCEYNSLEYESIETNCGSLETRGCNFCEKKEIELTDKTLCMHCRLWKLKEEIK